MGGVLAPRGTGLTAADAHLAPTPLSALCSLCDGASLWVYLDLSDNEILRIVAMGEHMYRVVFPLLLWSSSALSGTNVFFSYSEWERMSDNQRSIYIAGAMDALMMYASNIDGPKLTAHFYSCLTKASLNNLQLANNVRAYTKQHPELQPGTVQIPLVHYLRALCGPVPQ